MKSIAAVDNDDDECSLFIYPSVVVVSSEEKKKKKRSSDLSLSLCYCCVCDLVTRLSTGKKTKKDVLVLSKKNRKKEREDWRVRTNKRSERSKSLLSSIEPEKKKEHN